MGVKPRSSKLRSGEKWHVGQKELLRASVARPSVHGQLPIERGPVHQNVLSVSPLFYYRSTSIGCSIFGQYVLLSASCFIIGATNNKTWARCNETFYYYLGCFISEHQTNRTQSCTPRPVSCYRNTVIYLPLSVSWHSSCINQEACQHWLARDNKLMPIVRGPAQFFPGQKACQLCLNSSVCIVYIV